MRTPLPLRPPHRLALTLRWTVPALLLGAACATAPTAGPVSPAPAVAPAPRRAGVPLPFAVPGSGRLELAVPDGWILDAPADKYAQWTERLASTPFEKTEVQRATRDGMATVSYLIPRYRELDVRQRHVHGFLVRDGVMAEVHVSKLQFDVADAVRFDAALRSARLE